MIITTAPQTITCDATIIGGGMVGVATAIGLARAGIRTALVDRLSADALTDPGFDGRASALAFATVRMLETLGIWHHLEPFAQPIEHIRVSDGEIGDTSLLHLHFDHTSLGEGPLGQMVENRHIRQGLLSAAAATDGLDLIAPAEVAQTERGAKSTRTLLADGREIVSPLILGIDGRGSAQRRSAGIEITQWGYGQHGVVCAVEFEHPHGGIAHEKFLPAGPFAILPLRGNRASLVWTERSDLVPAIMALDDAAFQSEIARRIGGFLGKVRCIGGRWSYPLGLHFAHAFVAERLALVGDSAHGIHPIAGQGLNLGLRDAAALIEVLAEAKAVGLDLGAPDVLMRYQRWRRADAHTLMAVTDALNRLFSNRVKPVALARRLGLAAVNRIPALKNFFMTHARGTVGDLPKLLRGESVV